MAYFKDCNNAHKQQRMLDLDKEADDIKTVSKFKVRWE